MADYSASADCEICSFGHCLLLAPPIFRLTYGPEYIIATLFMPTSIRTIHDHVVPEKTTTLNIKITVLGCNRVVEELGTTYNDCS